VKSVERALRKRRRRIVGLMSGTSADGVDAALVDIESLDRAQPALSWELLDFITVPYSDALRTEILAVQEHAERAVERLTRLHFTLGERFADAVERLVREAGVPLESVDVVGSHGQTVCHLSGATLQVGEPAVMAERLGLPVISNFRSRDMAAGGTGAPLVPLIDHLLFADPERSRLALNVGGIANFSALRRGAAASDVIALDTGPGNMVIDALVGLLTDGAKHMDAGGGMARKGTPHEGIVGEALEAPWFRKAPPRAAGREEFGLDYAKAFLERCRRERLSDAAMLATATRLTARAVHDAYERFVQGGFTIDEVIVSGGGAHNVALLEQLSGLFAGKQVVSSDYYGLDVDAKEAVAFALLAYRTLDGEAGNLPNVTGAAHPVLLGSITPGDRP
jgi:anhydro-N-acetylmuramic acid kinase